jgi:hypothetical protein
MVVVHNHVNQNNIAGSRRYPDPAGERDDVILDVAGTWTGLAACRRARVLPLKFVLDLQRPTLAR